MTPVDVPPEQLAAIAATVGDGGANLIVRLFVADVQPYQDMPLSELVEASFSGYEPFSAATWTGPFEDDAGEVYYVSQPIRFQWYGDAGAPQTVYGVRVSIAQGGVAGAAGGAPEHLVRATRLGQPYTFSAPGEQLELVVQVPASAGG